MVEKLIAIAVIIIACPLIFYLYSQNVSGGRNNNGGSSGGADGGSYDGSGDCGGDGGGGGGD